MPDGGASAAAASCCGVDATRVHPLTIIDQHFKAQTRLQDCRHLSVSLLYDAHEVLSLSTVTVTHEMVTNRYRDGGCEILKNVKQKTSQGTQFEGSLSSNLVLKTHDSIC